MRGEYLVGCRVSDGHVELPPRARRIPSIKSINHPTRGTTSACAENTFTVEVVRVTVQNYLRVRGEYGDYPEPVYDMAELPPRARRIP